MRYKENNGIHLAFTVLHNKVRGLQGMSTNYDYTELRDQIIHGYALLNVIDCKRLARTDKPFLLGVKDKLNGLSEGIKTEKITSLAYLYNRIAECNNMLDSIIQWHI
jgi:hypothetical protein